MKRECTLVVYVIVLFHIGFVQGERPEIKRSIRSGGADANAYVDLGDEKSEVIGSGKPGGANGEDRELGWWSSSSSKSSKSTSTDYPTLYPTQYPTLYPTLAPTYCGKSGKSKSTSCWSGSWSWKSWRSRDGHRELDGDAVRNLNDSGKPGSRDMLVDKADEEDIVEITSNMNTRRRINGGKPTLQVAKENGAV